MRTGRSVDADMDLAPASRTFDPHPHGRATRKTRLVPVTLGTRPAGSLEPFVSPLAGRELDAAQREAAELLAGRVVWHVSSTARGGGVAEMLRTLAPYWRGAGVDARWLVLEARRDFFAFTKRLHALLHGQDVAPPGPDDRRLYEEVSVQAARQALAAVAPGDVVVLHDPQTAGLTALIANIDAVVIWRCHVGADLPSEAVRSAWRFLLPYVAPADAHVFTRDTFIPAELRGSRAWRLTPAIDPCSAKNRPLDSRATEAILATSGIVRGPESPSCLLVVADGRTVAVRRRCALVEEGPPPRAGEAPLVVALSRWDRLKDPIGIIRGFVSHVEHPAARLVVAGPAVDAIADDPEAAGVLAETRRVWTQLPFADRTRVQLACLPMVDLDENALIVNALQRQASVIVKKSLQEGFGLGITEGLWKSRPVIATRVGGQADQIIDGETGILLDDPADLEGFGAAIDMVLDAADGGAALGRRGRERVRERYLADRHYIGLARIIADTIASRPDREVSRAASEVAGRC